MDNLNSHSEHADQSQEQQANVLPLPVPTSQVLDNHMIEQQHANLSPFGFFREQHRMQLDQVLQHYNEQVWILQQRQIAIQNATVENLLRADALIQKDQEIASLRIELQRKQDDWNQLFQFAMMAYQMVRSRIRIVPPVQQETNSHVSSNELDAPGSGDEATSKVRTTAETTKTDFICEVCNSGLGCMVFVPCKHFCACKPCSFRLTACPLCGVKGEVTEPNLVEK